MATRTNRMRRYSHWTTHGLSQTSQTLNGENIDWRLLQDQNKIYTIDYANQAARLLRTIGDLLGNKWGKYSTTADTNNSCKVLKQMGYQVPKELSTFNTDTLLMSLFFRRPVIVRGQDEKIFQNGKWEYKNGHAWIIDGYTRQKGTQITYRIRRRQIKHLERILFHCNWDGTAYTTVTLNQEFSIAECQLFQITLRKIREYTQEGAADHTVNTINTTYSVYLTFNHSAINKGSFC